VRSTVYSQKLATLYQAGPHGSRFEDWDDRSFPPRREDCSAQRFQQRIPRFGEVAFLLRWRVLNSLCVVIPDSSSAKHSESWIRVTRSAVVGSEGCLYGTLAIAFKYPSAGHGEKMITKWALLHTCLRTNEGRGGMKRGRRSTNNQDEDPSSSFLLHKQLETTTISIMAATIKQ
jgi:hypothetical protein